MQLGGSMLAADDGAALRPQPRALLVGQRSRALRVSPRQAFRTVAVRLRPGALGRRAPRARWSAHRRVGRARGALRPRGAEPRRAARGGARTTPMRRAALERFLRRRLAGARPSAHLEQALALRPTAPAGGSPSGRCARPPAPPSAGSSARSTARWGSLRGPWPRCSGCRRRCCCGPPSRAGPASPPSSRTSTSLTSTASSAGTPGCPPAALLEALGPLARAFIDPGRLRELLGVGIRPRHGAGPRQQDEPTLLLPGTSMTLVALLLLSAAPECPPVDARARQASPSSAGSPAPGPATTAARSTRRSGSPPRAG